MATRKQKKRAVSKKDEELAAQAAAAEAVEELEETEEEVFENDGVSIEFGEDQVNTMASDVFEEGFKRAVAKRDSPRYHIKKNSQFLTVKDYPYSWERLQEEYGGGYYQVFCKGRSSGQILKQQTESIAEREEALGKKGLVDASNDGAKQDGNLAILAMMNQFQERADERARAETKNGESSIATIMQTVVQVQQQSSRDMMMMIQESNKQFQTMIVSMMQSQQSPKGPDPMLTLLTSLLTQKDKGDGFTAAGVMKMVQDAEIRAETRATKTFEMIEKKSNELADIKAEALAGGGEETGDESFTKTLVKGFLPVLSQMAANQQKSPEQLHMEGQMRDQALNQGFIEPQPVQAIPAARPQPRKPQPLNPQAASQVVPQQTVPVQGADQRKTGNVVQLPKDPEQLSRLKVQLFDFCAVDIGQAMMAGESASITAETCLKKLEIEGVPRQTVSNLYELKDFYGYADNYGLPEEAKKWLKEFHEAIQASVKPVAANSNPPPTGTNGNGSKVHDVGGNTPIDVGAKPQPPAAQPKPQPVTRGPRVTGTRARPGESAKNL